MEAEGLGPSVIEAFRHYYAKVSDGADGLIGESEIERIHPAELLQADVLSGFAAAGKKALAKTIMIVLNGGLGTSMGLGSAKSLIPVKDEASFLEITLNQALHQGVGLCFMNSFSTHKATADFIAARDFPRPIMYFSQNKFPKIFRKSLAPATWRKNPNLEWNPPGHGDIYTAIYASGTLHRLLEAGIRYAFVSNSDNLGATLDEALLGYFVESGIPFMMEVSRRGPGDIKGGHLARRTDGRLVLRELSQCPQTDLARFQDLAHHCFFNTNNIWIDLAALDKRIKKGGPIRLPLILNPKTLDPKDECSPAVFQIETAMGSAVSLFDGARAVAVARERFLPVKTCNDLLVIRSDRFLLSPESRLVPNPENRTETTRVRLDPKFYGRLESLERRFPFGPPSLSGCSSLIVEGDVRFGRGVVLQGEVTIRNRRKRQAAVAAGTVIEGELGFD